MLPRRQVDETQPNFVFYFLSFFPQFSILHLLLFKLVLNCCFFLPSSSTDDAVWVIALWQNWTMGGHLPIILLLEHFQQTRHQKLLSSSSYILMETKCLYFTCHFWGFFFLLKSAETQNTHTLSDCLGKENKSNLKKVFMYKHLSPK